MIDADLPPDHSARERDYRAEYLKWIASLDPKDRALARELGIDRPKVEPTSLAWARPAVFRESPSAAGFGANLGGGDFADPAELIDEPEAQTDNGEADIDDGDLARLSAYDGEILRALIAVLFFPKVGRKRVCIRAGFFRLVALAHSLHAEGIGEMSLAQLAAKAGCSKALLSAYCVKFRDFASLDCRAGKTVAARAKYSTARLWAPGAKGKRSGAWARHIGQAPDDADSEPAPAS